MREGERGEGGREGIGRERERERDEREQWISFKAYPIHYWRKKNLSIDL